MLATCRNEGVSLAISHKRGEEGGNQGFFFQILQVGVQYPSPKYAPI